MADGSNNPTGRQCWRALEMIHIVDYFSPESRQAYADLGLGRASGYVASRSAAFGTVPPAVVTSSFYVFSPHLIEQALTAAWRHTGPQRVLEARFGAVDRTLRRVLDGADVAEAARLARAACEGLQPGCRPLFAAHASIPWPEDPLLQLWHAATLVREHRGDGHVAVLLTAGLDPLEALITGGLQSGTTDFLKKTRGWPEQAWQDALARLVDRGLIEPDGRLSTNGRQLRQEIEDVTDERAAEPWQQLGDSGTERLLGALHPLRRAVLDSDVLPAWMTASKSQSKV